MKYSAHFFIIAALMAACLLPGCARVPLQGPENAMRLVDAPELRDDLPLAPLLEAIQTEIRFLEDPATPPPVEHGFRFADQFYTTEEYLRGLRRFLELTAAPNALDKPAELRKQLIAEFDFYEVYGQDFWGDTFITAYYEPYLRGSTVPTAQFSQPLYARPADLVTLNLALFDSKYNLERILRGRLVGDSLVPYFTRAEIDTNKVLQGRNLELCWVDPLDGYFLQVQGSGTIQLEDPQGNIKQLRLNYADKNGHFYESFRQFLCDLLDPDDMTRPTIEAILHKLSPAELRERLNNNPSYVFFKISAQSARTYLGVPATAGRTIATDPRYFPKGALALLSFEKPVFANADSINPESSLSITRFVLDQDKGGAITGGGRVDLFWGHGDEAGRYAGIMKHSGRLVYLAPHRPVR